jgi:hypothetical protein
VDIAARYIVENGLVESVNILAKRLEQLQQLDSSLTVDLVIKLLIDDDFEIGKVDDILFNLVGLASSQNDLQELSPIDKQNIYQTSRAPLYALMEELKPLEGRLSMIRWGTESKEHKNLSKRVKRLQEKIKSTRIDVTNDVYERINNSGGVMGIVGESGVMSIDLHALHVEEAKSVLAEYARFLLNPLGTYFLFSPSFAKS